VGPAARTTARAGDRVARKILRDLVRRKERGVYAASPTVMTLSVRESLV
jgi:hypothetical protein